MGKNTSIPWCDSTSNPVTGCAGCELWRPSKGIKVCYAGRITENPKFGGRAGDFAKVRHYPDRVAQALRWPDLTGTGRQDKPWLDGLPRLIFWNDMGDPEPRSWLGLETVRAMSASPHVHQILTKRPSLLRSWLASVPTLTERWWLGTSVTSQATVGRVAHLTAYRFEAPVKLFVSVEPAWGPVSLGEHLKHVDWVLWGGESGSGAKPADLDWARRLRDDCEAAGKAFFMKQLGTGLAGRGKGEGMEELPEDLRIRQMPMAPVRLAEQAELF